MQEIPSENWQALQDSNWEERLKKARAQREAVLSARSTEKLGGRDELVFRPKKKSVDAVDGLRPAPDKRVLQTVAKPDQPPIGQRASVAPEKQRVSAPVAPKAPPVAVRVPPPTFVRPAAPVVAKVAPKPAEPRAPKRSTRSRVVYIALGFSAGIGVGVAGVLFKDRLLPTETHVVAENSALPMGLETPPVDVSASLQPAPAVPEPVTDVATVPLVGQSFLTDLRNDLTVPAGQGSPIAPTAVAPLPAISLDYASIDVPVPDTLPVIEPAPVAPVSDVATVATFLSATIGTQPFDPSTVQGFGTGTAFLGTISTDFIGAFIHDTGPEETLRLTGLHPRPSLPVPGTGEVSYLLPGHPLPFTAVEPIAPLAGVEASAAPEIAVAFQAPDFRQALVPLPLDTVSGGNPSADTNPPKTPVQGADGLSVWIYAEATVDDADMEAVRSVVQTLGLPVRVVQRVEYRISRNQVRFYEAGSAEVADVLAARVDAQSRDFVGSNANLGPGVLEIYLTGGPEVIAEPVTVAEEAVDVPNDEDVNALRESVLSKLRGE